MCFPMSVIDANVWMIGDGGCLLVFLAVTMSFGLIFSVYVSCIEEDFCIYAPCRLLEDYTAWR